MKTEEVLSRVVERDVEALGSLYDKFAPRLMGVLVRILSAAPEAESALQEVFLRLWKEAPSIAQTKGSLAAWLVLTARHAAFRRIRAQRIVASRMAQHLPGQEHAKEEKRTGNSAESNRKEAKLREGRSTRRDSETLVFLTACPQTWMPRPEHIALVDARLSLLQRVFNQMPKPQRRVLDLTVFGGYTESEIAEQLGEPLGKVKAGLRAAFTFMRHRQQAVLGTWTADI